MNTRLFIVIASAIVLAALPNTIRAAEPPTITIDMREAALGRIFMSRAERQQLDRLRLQPEQHTVTQEATDALNNAPQTTDEPDAAGYILSSSGTPYQWIGGDFRKSTVAEIDADSLPGQIPIVRHRRIPESGDDDHADEKSSGREKDSQQSAKDAAEE